jgi:hypothetical protein
MEELIKNELEFCKEIDAEKNEHGQYIYESKNKASSMNLPYILEEYKQWLIDKKIVKLSQ